jgi:small-conductance mechanosensitive channel
MPVLRSGVTAVTVRRPGYRNRSGCLAFAISVMICASASAQQQGPATAPITSQTAPSLVKSAEVRLHDSLVFKIALDRKQESAEARARAASRALERALEGERSDVRVETHGDARAIFVGETPVVELYPEDALGAAVSLDVYAARLAGQVRDAIVAEKRRSDIAASVFSISLVVFFGFIALYVLRRIGELTQRARELILEHPERIMPVRLNRLEVIGAGPLRALLLAAAILGRWVLQVGVVYIWLVLSLSRFDATRPYTDRLTSALLVPLGSLAQRALSALPLAVLTLAFAVSVYVVLRFVELFFSGLTRSPERPVWVPPDLLLPTSMLLRAGVVLLALIFAGPALTGDPESVLGHLGSSVLLALALAITPLLCSGVLGVVTMFSRRVRVGRQVELGEHVGRVVSVGLLDVWLRDAQGADVRVPHLSALLKPLRVPVSEPRLSVDVCVSADADPANVVRVLQSAAEPIGERPRVELRDIDADGARYRVSVFVSSERSQSELRMSLAQALLREQIAWGRPRASGAASS